MKNIDLDIVVLIRALRLNHSDVITFRPESSSSINLSLQVVHVVNRSRSALSYSIMIFLLNHVLYLRL